MPVALQIEDTSQLPPDHSILSDFSAYHDSYRAKERSDCGIIVLKLNMLRLAGHTEVPLHWLLPLTEQQKLNYESCTIQASLFLSTPYVCLLVFYLHVLSCSVESL